MGMKNSARKYRELFTARDKSIIEFYPKIKGKKMARRSSATLVNGAKKSKRKCFAFAPLPLEVIRFAA